MLKRVAFLICTIFTCLFWCASLHADLTRIVARHWGEQGTYTAGRYIWVNADMHGVVDRADGSTGKYRVPVTLIYAETAPAKVGLVDLINSASYQLMKTGIQPIPRHIATAHGQKLMGDYLWRTGMTYISLQWSKMVTEVRGDDYGLIENGEDGYQIMADAARFLRAPIHVEGNVAFQPKPVDYAVSFGFSQPAFVQWAMFNAGLNRTGDGSLVFDGMLAAVGGLTDKCRILNNDSTPRTSPYTPSHPTYYHEVDCRPTIPDDGKMIKLETETELMYGAAHTRFEADNFRQYEIAGVSHVTPKVLNMGRIGLNDQNYVSTNEYIKAAFQLLVDWVRDGTVPPENVYIDGELKTDGSFVVSRDADGNALGGIRPPHMISRLKDGTETGAPLGSYSGKREAPGPLEEQPEDTTAFWYFLPIIGGQFTPFSRERLRALYPTKDDYRHRVKRSADALLADGFLLEEDHRSIVLNAQYWDYTDR